MLSVMGDKVTGMHLLLTGSRDLVRCSDWLARLYRFASSARQEIVRRGANMRSAGKSQEGREGKGMKPQAPRRAQAAMGPEQGLIKSGQTTAHTR